MRALRTRFRPDNIPSEQRTASGSAGRVIYLILLGLFTLAVCNYFFGDFLLFRADGLILRDRSVVATTYIARVDSVDVREGQIVEKGTPLLKLQSLEILERLADLTTKRAELIAKVTDFKIRMETSRLLLPLAGRRVSKSESVVKKSGDFTSARQEEALRSNFDSQRDYATLDAENRVLQDELAALQAALANANVTLQDLQALYANGLVRAPVSGATGPTVPPVGNVYRPGEPLLTIYFGEPYVLVYLPRRYLFPIHTGMNLKMTDGKNAANGTIVEILPVTDTLPKEFQNTFQPSGRNQLAKIKLESSMPFPLLQTVHVSRPLLQLFAASTWMPVFGGP